MTELDEILKIANIHADRIRIAIKHIGHLFPLNEQKLKNMSENDLAWVDLLINRFGKLQDFIGTKVIDLFFQIQQENISRFTMLDKIHKLEKLEIVESAELWKEMSKVRNHIAHEYPDNPEIMAEYMNKIMELTPDLLKILENIKTRINYIS